ncbi:MAG: hypothetical protein COB04_06165 [Gammaproteobacteria bacterium]|nr:MAG: hypothetical protein COB04_06165 [Gammaproteobacteria bacterium]
MKSNCVTNEDIPSERIRTPRPDRRASNKYAINCSHLGFRGRRGKDASVTYHTNNYVDWYEPSLFAVSVLIVILSAFDATMTLALLDKGAYEANALMDGLLNESVSKFVLYKMSLTSLCVIFLVVHKNFVVFRLFKAVHALYLMLILYGLLLLWESYLLKVIS